MYFSSESVIERLKGTPIRLSDKILSITEEKLTLKPENKWSILENIGHLLDLEPLWEGRLDDILNNKNEMRAADLENKKTELAIITVKRFRIFLINFQKVVIELFLNWMRFLEKKFINPHFIPD